MAAEGLLARFNHPARVAERIATLDLLSFSFVEPHQAKAWVDDYYATLASEACVPAGFAVNPQVACVLPFMCHHEEETAIQRGLDGAHFFGYALAHYYVFGDHVPNWTSIWDEFEANRSASRWSCSPARSCRSSPSGLSSASAPGGSGSPRRSRRRWLSRPGRRRSGRSGPGPG
jgi:hypothetical protein